MHLRMLRQAAPGNNRTASAMFAHREGSVRRGTTMYDLLKTIDDPAALRALDRHELKPLAEELRAYVLDSVSQTGGHLSSNLGTVELTIRLHYVFDTPHDRMEW